MAKAVRNIRSDGTLRTIASSPAGPADDFQSSGAINSNGILSQRGNNGNVVQQLLGDGRLWTPIQPVTPGSLAPGQYFIETVAGVEYFVYVDAGGIARYLAPTNIVSADIPVPVGPPVTLDSDLVDDSRFAAYNYTAYNATTGEQEGGALYIGHDGSTGSDATTAQVNTSVNVAFGVPAITFAIALTGVGVAQTWTLSATAIAPDWAVAYVRQMRF